MTVHIIIPYSQSKNLGEAYNQAMKLIPDNDAACFVDGDTCFLTPDFGTIINRYANENPNAVLTCYTNRIHHLAKGQLHPVVTSTDIGECIRFAESIKGHTTTTRINGPVSGFLLVIPKHIWQWHPFTEVNTFRPAEPNLLGCDNEWTNRVRAAGIQILRMDGLFLWHSYRLLNGTKTHLL